MSARDEVVASGQGPAPTAALLALLPLAVLALPSGFELARDPEPTAAAAGWVWLLGLPALALSLGAAHFARPRAVWLWLLPASAFFLSSGTDSFEEHRALLGFATALAVAVAAVQWHAAHRRLFQAGLVVASAAFTTVALARGADAGWGGTLGNSGTLSQAALPGALIGVAWALDERGWRRPLGAASALLFLVHAWLAPVLAASLAIAASLVFFSAATRSARALAVAAVVLAGLALPLGSSSGAVPGSGELATPASATGGVGVRLELWRALPGMWLDAPWRGTGPGQFRAEFPPYRTQAEIEATTHGRRLWEETEVEHAHSDVLQAPVEFGLLGGLGWWLLWALVAVRAWSAARSSDATLRAAALAGVGLLAAATVHSPLFHNPLGAWSAWALFGMLLGSARAALPRATFARALPLVLLAALALPAWRFVRHGSGLARAMEAGGLTEGVTRALDAAPDSPLALALCARAQAAAGERAASETTWRQLLEHRPHSLEALQQLGFLAAGAGDSDQAAEYWYRALALDPGHPRLLRNLARLEVERGGYSRAVGHLLDLQATDDLDKELTYDLGARVLLAGELGPGLGIVSMSEVGTLLAQPEDLYGRAEHLKEHEFVSDALRMWAHRLWAHRHAHDGDWRAASVSLRQALKLVQHRTDRHSNTAATLIRAELAAALWLRDQPEEARGVAEEIDLEVLRRATADYDEERVELIGVGTGTVAPFAREPLAQLGIAFED